jgi:hypothetical protein
MIVGERLRFAAKVGGAIAAKSGKLQHLMVWQAPDGRIEWRFQDTPEPLFWGDQFQGFVCKPPSLST